MKTKIETCGMCLEPIPEEDEVEFIETVVNGVRVMSPYCEDCAWQIEIKNGDKVE